MTENPINPAALYDYAASKNDMDSLRPEERTFLEACAWEWERLIDHGAEEWGKQFEALGIKPGVPQAPSAKPTPAAPEKPAPSSPAAERADEGLEEEAERLREAYTNDEGSWLEWPDCRQEPWLRVARAARALRRGGVTEGAIEAIARDVLAPFHGSDPLEPEWLTEAVAKIRKHVALDSGASVVVDREPSVSLDAYCAKVTEADDLNAKVCAFMAERDALAAKLAEAERALCERAEQVDKLMQERDLVMARLGNFCQPGEIEDRIRILQGHAGKMERQRDEARAEAERLRGERDAAMAEIQATYRGVQQMMEAALGRTLERSDKLVQPDFPSLAAKLAALRTAAPTVAVTDVEAAAAEMALRFTDDFTTEPTARADYLAILRTHTRAASVEEVAKAICEADMGDGRRIHLWERQTDFAKREYRAFARAALRALGVREAEKAYCSGAPDGQASTHLWRCEKCGEHAKGGGA